VVIFDQPHDITTLKTIKSHNEKYVYSFFCFFKERDASLITHQSMSKIPLYK
jgi:hypothetical protein